MEWENSEGQAFLDAVYDAEVAEQDAQIGRLISRLKKARVWDRLFLVVVADHGDHLGDKKRLNHAFGVYEPLTHVPLIIRDPLGHFAPGKVVETTVSTRRIFHTILTAAGASTLPEEAFSLVHESTGKNSEVENEVLTEGYPLNWAIQRLEYKRPGLVKRLGEQELSHGLYFEDFKLISGRDRVELYNVKRDTQEIDNLNDQRSDVLWGQSMLEEKLKGLQLATNPIGHAGKLHIDDAVRDHLRDLGYLE